MLGLVHTSSKRRAESIIQFESTQLPLRRRNTIYKNLQLGAQHCFCSSLSSMFLVFLPSINLACNKILCCKLSSFVAQSRLSIYFEIQVLALFLVFHRNYNLAHNKILILTNQCARFVQLATQDFVAYQVDRAV